MIEEYSAIGRLVASLPALAPRGRGTLAV